MTSATLNPAPVGTNITAIAAINEILNRQAGRLLNETKMMDLLGEIGTAIYASNNVAKQVRVDSLSCTRPFIAAE